MSESTKEQAKDFDSALVSAPADGALAALDAAGARGPALIDAWVKAGNAAAVAVAAERASGAVRKAARRGENVLRSRGIKADAGPRVASIPKSSGEAATTEAWLIPPDPGGTVLIVIASRSVTSRAQSGFFYLHDSVGVHQANVGELSGGKLKDALRRTSESGLEPVRISIAYARRRIADARTEQKSKGIPEPLGMMSARELLEPVPEQAEPHPLDAEGLELADDDAKTLVKSSMSLHSLPEFRGWMPDRGAVDQLLQEVGKQLGGGEEPPPDKLKAALDDAVNAATDRYFAPERRASLVRLMKDSALGVLASQGEVRALEVVATMRCIEQAGLITDPPHDIPFLCGFFQKAIAALAFQGGGRLQVPVARGPAEAPSATPE